MRWITLALLFCLGSVAYGQKPVSFIQDVAPILKESCFACHDAKRKNGKYDMTTFEKLMAGGANGEAIVAGKPLESDFHDLIVTQEERRMPPREKGEAVAVAKAKIVETWIAQGAKLDAGLDPKADLVRELRLRWTPPTPPQAYQFPTIINSVAFTPDNKALVVGGHHELLVWSVEGKLLKRIRTRAERAYAIQFLPSGQVVVAGGRPGQEGDVRLYNLDAPGQTEAGVVMLDGVSDKKVMLEQLLDCEDSVLCLAMSPDGQQLAAAGCDRTVRLWELKPGQSAKLTQSLDNHADWVLGLAFSDDGKLLASSARDKTAKVWDLKAKESILTFQDHQSPVYSVILNADASLGYSVGADKQIRTWKPTGEGKGGKPLGSHGDEVFRIVRHPSGIAATSSADKSVKLWDLSNAKELKNLTGLTDFAYAVAISPDGQKVAGGSYDGEVRIWTITDGKLLSGFNATPRAGK
ncbi:MAG: c-type cytochrome domain-containing protein [Fimbriiglobus sp.]